MSKRAFGELELSILQCFKKHPRLTVKEVVQLLGAKDKYTTIMTVMNRLAEKKILLRERQGQQYIYFSSEQKSSPTFLNQLKQKLFGGNSASMACYLIESGDVSDVELEKIENLIKDMKKQRK